MSSSDPSRPADAADTPERQAQEAVRRHAERQRVFSTHATVFVAGMVVIFLVNLAINIAAGLTGEWWAWWSVWALVGWGIGLATHGLVVRLSRPPMPDPVRSS